MHTFTGFAEPQHFSEFVGHNCFTCLRASLGQNCEVAKKIMVMSRMIGSDERCTVISCPHVWVPVTMRWCILRLWKEEMAPRYGG